MDKRKHCRKVDCVSLISYRLTVQAEQGLLILGKGFDIKLCCGAQTQFLVCVHDYQAVFGDFQHILCKQE